MNALPRTNPYTLEVCAKAIRDLPDDREELALECALDAVTLKVEKAGDTAELLADLHEARHALDHIASRIDLPYFHAKAFRTLLDRVRWLERAVEAEMENDDD